MAKNKLTPVQIASNAAIECRQLILELRTLHNNCVVPEVLFEKSETFLERAIRAAQDAIEALDPLI